MKCISIKILILITLIICYDISAAQVDWDQKLDGWIDGQYQPYLFLGGNYYTKVSFADIDGDGDYDMFVGGGGTGSFKLFENYGDCYEHQFRLKDVIHPGIITGYKGRTLDAEFGDLDYDGDLDAIIMLNCILPNPTISNRYVNNGNEFNPIWELPPYSQQVLIPSLGPTSLIDIDGDSDLDIISGMQDSTIRLCTRTNDTIPYFELTETHLGHVNISPAYFIDVADLDADNDYDLIACCHNGINKYYENIGGPGIDSLEWVLVDSNFLTDQYTPDWVECPELVDIDADGDLDLFLAGAFAHLNYFENTGTPQSPHFEHQYDTTYFYNFPMNINKAQFVDIDNDGDQDIAANTMLLRNDGPAYNPHWTTEPSFFPNSFYKKFCDIDDDGDQDIIFAYYSYIILIKNIGTSENPVWDEGNYLLQDSHTSYIYAVVPVDIDDDNDYDLMLNCLASHDLVYFRNIGDSSNPEFEYVTNSYIGFDGDESTFDPDFADIDLDGDLDIFISYAGYWDDRSQLLYYENVGTPQEAVWDSVTNDYMGWFSSGLVNHAYLDCGDYDSDGDPDILMSYSQGLLLFINQTIPTDIIHFNNETNNPEIIQTLDIKTYPNPFNQNITFQFDLSQPTEIEINIYNILGQIVDSVFISGCQTGDNLFIWNAGNLPSGIYFYKMLTNNAENNGKVILLK